MAATTVSDPNLLGAEELLNALIQAREVQDYDNIIHLVENITKDYYENNAMHSTTIKHLYAFALNRRNKDGDREKAIQECESLLNKDENSEVMCLIGRINKDKFVESKYTNKNSLTQSIKWYRRAYEIGNGNIEYGGINLATLLVVSGEDFDSSEEIQLLVDTISKLIQQRGDLPSLTNYWDVATVFEVSILAKDYHKAIEAAEHMYQMNPINWNLQSTMKNIKMIDEFDKEGDKSYIMEFWINFFSESCSTANEDKTEFLSLVNYGQLNLIPQHISLIVSPEGNLLKFHHCNKEISEETHLINASSVENIRSLNDDDRQLTIFIKTTEVKEIEIFLPSSQQKLIFYKNVSKLTGKAAEDLNKITEESNEDAEVAEKSWCNIA